MRSRQVRCGKQDSNAVRKTLHTAQPAVRKTLHRAQHAEQKSMHWGLSVSVMHCSAVEGGHDEEVWRDPDSSYLVRTFSYS